MQGITAVEKRRETTWNRHASKQNVQSTKRRERTGPAEYLWIPDAHGGRVVPVNGVQRLYSHDWKSNVSSYFGLTPMAPYSSTSTKDYIAGADGRAEIGI